jgi:hypothetical protein
VENWKFYKNGISKNDLPLSVEVNGVTYYSSLKMAKVHNAWYEMGVDDGKSEGYKLAQVEYLSHIEEARKEGYKEGYDNGREVKLRKMVEHFAVPSTKGMGSKTWNETIFGSGYNTGYVSGYKDCREVAEHILKYGRDTDGVE